MKGPRPATDDPLDFGIRLPTDMLHRLGSGGALQRCHHVADLHGEPGHDEGTGVLNAAGRSWARIRAAIAWRGDKIAIRVSGDTGHSASRPVSGSRMMLLANDEAARFGFPGRTTMVGKRTARPSTKFLRE